MGFNSGFKGLMPVQFTDTAARRIQWRYAIHRC